MKIWEGALDLCNFIDNCDKNDFVGKKVLEVKFYIKYNYNIIKLGCGAALPTIMALKKGVDLAVVLDFVII